MCSLTSSFNAEQLIEGGDDEVLRGGRYSVDAVQVGPVGRGVPGGGELSLRVRVHPPALGPPVHQEPVTVRSLVGMEGYPVEDVQNKDRHKKLFAGYKLLIVLIV